MNCVVYYFYIIKLMHSISFYIQTIMIYNGYYTICHIFYNELNDTYNIREVEYRLRHRARETLFSSSMGYAHRERSAFSMITPITLILFYTT